MTITTSTDPRLAAVATALEASRDAEASVARAIQAASASGLSAARLATDLGLTTYQVQYRGYKGVWPSLTPGRAPKLADVVPDGCVTVTEAARRLGVSRVTVYAWLGSGKLTAESSFSGRRFVRLAA